MKNMEGKNHIYIPRKMGKVLYKRSHYNNTTSENMNLSIVEFT